MVFIELIVSARLYAETWQGVSRTSQTLQALPHVGMGLYTPLQPWFLSVNENKLHPGLVV